MIEEPYRWVEAIANRRDYIEGQLAGGNPIVALGYPEGILFLTHSRDHQKIFEIYDRIAVGSIGHPGDIERLRVTTIELASSEGFTRSPADVSLRRMTTYSLSPALKSAFEQIYGPPYLARLLFAELGHKPEQDLFVRVEYDGSLATNGATFSRARREFGVLSGTAKSTRLMEEFLDKTPSGGADLKSAVHTALDALAVGTLALDEDCPDTLPETEAIAKTRESRLESSGLEAAILDRTSPIAVTFRTLSDSETRALVAF